MVDKGKGMLKTNTVSFPLSEETIFIVFPLSETNIIPDADNPLSLSWVGFSGYMIEHYLLRGGITPVYPISYDTSDHKIRMHFGEINAAAHKPANRYCTMVSNLYAIFALLLDNCYKTTYPEKYSDNYFFIKALEYIEIYYRTNVSIENLADNIGISRKHLYLIFKHAISIPPKNYLIFFRLDKAASLLEGRNLSVEEISQMVGYATPNYFAKEFKRITGFSPTTYKEKIRKKEISPYCSPIGEISSQILSKQE
jgi:AraC-like DNA-binding protein